MHAELHLGFPTRLKLVNGISIRFDFIPFFPLHPYPISVFFSFLFLRCTSSSSPNGPAEYTYSLFCHNVMQKHGCFETLGWWSAFLREKGTPGDKMLVQYLFRIFRRA